MPSCGRVAFPSHPRTPYRLSYLTTFTLCSFPCDLGGLRILVVLRVKRLRGRSVLYEFSEKYTPRLLEEATLDF